MMSCLPVLVCHRDIDKSVVVVGEVDRFNRGIIIKKPVSHKKRITVADSVSPAVESMELSLIREKAAGAWS